MILAAERAYRGVEFSHVANKATTPQIACNQIAMYYLHRLEKKSNVAIHHGDPVNGEL
jgi:hypothetical protein